MSYRESRESEGYSFGDAKRKRLIPEFSNNADSVKQHYQALSNRSVSVHCGIEGHYLYLGSNAK